MCRQWWPKFSISSLHLLNRLMVEPTKIAAELQAKMLDESKTIARVVADSCDLQKLCFVDGEPLIGTAAQRELLSLYAQAMKIWIRRLGQELPSWLTIVDCVICKPSYEEAFWPGLAEMGDHEGFHCADPEHITRFHSVAPQTRNCCELSYHPDRPYAWRSSVIGKVETSSPTSIAVSFVDLSELQSDEKSLESAPNHPEK